MGVPPQIIDARSQSIHFALLSCSPCFHGILAKEITEVEKSFENHGNSLENPLQINLSSSFNHVPSQPKTLQKWLGLSFCRLRCYRWLLQSVQSSKLWNLMSNWSNLPVHSSADGNLRGLCPHVSHVPLPSTSQVLVAVSMIGQWFQPLPMILFSHRWLMNKKCSIVQTHLEVRFSS